MIRLFPVLLFLVAACGAPPQPDPVIGTGAPAFRITPRIDFDWPMHRPPEQREHDCVVTAADGADFPRFFVDRVTATATTVLERDQVEGTLKTSLCTSIIRLDGLRPGKTLITVMLTGTLMQDETKSARCRFYAHEEADLVQYQILQSSKPFHGGCGEQF